MTNKEQYDIIECSVKASDAKSYCFCKGSHHNLCAKLQVAGVDPHIVIQVAGTRHYVAGMRGCCVSSEKFLEEAAKILDIKASSTS